MKLSVIHGDITKMNTDAIVNAANTSLMGGGGVDGAIHKAGGPEILEACMDIRNHQGGCATGEAVITYAGNLPCEYVIHTVGPVWRGGDHGEPELLASCYRSIFKRLEEHDIKSIAIPNISTGIYGYPKDLAAKVAIETLENIHIDWEVEVIFVCFDDENYKIYMNLIEN